MPEKSILSTAAIMLLALSIASCVQSSTATTGSASGDWTTYLQGITRPGFNAAETIINPSTASSLSLLWSVQSTGCQGSPSGSTTVISTQPIVVNELGSVFWGSWDGCEHATNLSGSPIWATFIGQNSAPGCDPSPVGVASTATYAVIEGGKTPAVLVGGGNATFYALNAETGAVVWKTSLGTPPNVFIWSSPAVYDGSVYIGVSSFGDCPLVQGKLVQMSANNGAIQHVFDVVPNGCVGGSIWSSPTIDAAAGTIYVTTGNGGRCSKAEPYGYAIVELSASTLAVLGHWQVPKSQRVEDSDFGSSPTLFQAKVGGVIKEYVGASNKNGFYYAWERGNLGEGLVWKIRIATGGSCPECGSGSISPSAWDGSSLYAAGGNTVIEGVSCEGNLRSLNPATGKSNWNLCVGGGPVLGPVTGVPGVLVIGAGTDLLAVNSATGATLWSFTTSGSIFYGGAVISDGVLYIGDTGGNLYAFAPP